MIDIPCGVTLPTGDEEEPAMICSSGKDSRQGRGGEHRGRDGAAAPGASDRPTAQIPAGGGKGGGHHVAGGACGRERNSVGGLRSSHAAKAEEEEDDNEVYPDNIEDFMATLLDGMRSDSVQLATSARNVVQNTYQVCVCAYVYVRAASMEPSRRAR